MPDRRRQKKSLLLFYVDFDDSLSAMNLGLKALSLEHFSTFVESYRTYLETKRSPAVEGPLFARSIRLCMDFLIDGQISSFCPDHTWAGFLTLIMLLQLIKFL